MRAAIGEYVGQQMGTLLAIGGLIVLGLAALVTGRDGDILTTVIAAIAGLGGFAAAGKRAP